MSRLGYARVIALLLVALVGAACGNDKPSSTASPSPTGPSLASTFVFGAPPDCATNKFCAQGLESVYGIVFKEVKSMADFGGPATVAALKAGAVNVAELFSTAIYEEGFTVLEDDKHLQAADNITPVIRSEVATDNVKSLLNAVSAALTTDGMLALNKQVDIEHKDAADVAEAFLKQQGLLTSQTNDGAGKTITVGVSGAFAESKIVAEMYAQVLENAGYTVKRQLELGNRKASDAALFSGKIDVKPEYLASEALALDPNAAASGDPAATAGILTTLLADKKVVALNYSSAVDTNVFVVTNTTAEKYGLSKVSDLAKPATA
jgi:osmoprotectant transport system substrate-binding protein